MTTDYLTENLLGDFLRQRFSDNFENDRVLKESNIRGRYDYIFYNEKIILEFDGYRHFNSSKQIISDKIKNQVANNLGFELIRIPYFVQLDSEVIDYYFGNLIKNKEKFNDYPHGFIDQKAMLPADFCELGQIEFTKFLETSKETEFNKSIINNLKELIVKNKDERLVIYSELKKFL
jgi:very-short-patch-repair endonuclease